MVGEGQASQAKGLFFNRPFLPLRPSQRPTKKGPFVTFSLTHIWHSFCDPNRPTKAKANNRFSTLLYWWQQCFPYSWIITGGCCWCVTRISCRFQQCVQCVTMSTCVVHNTNRAESQHRFRDQVHLHEVGAEDLARAWIQSRDFETVFECGVSKNSFVTFTHQKTEKRWHDILLQISLVILDYLRPDSSHLFQNIIWYVDKTSQHQNEP